MKSIISCFLYAISTLLVGVDLYSQSYTGTWSLTRYAPSFDAQDATTWTGAINIYEKEGVIWTEIDLLTHEVNLRTLHANIDGYYFFGRSLLSIGSHPHQIYDCTITKEPRGHKLFEDSYQIYLATNDIMVQEQLKLVEKESINSPFYYYGGIIEKIIKVESSDWDHQYDFIGKPSENTKNAFVVQRILSKKEKESSTFNFNAYTPGAIDPTLAEKYQIKIQRNKFTSFIGARDQFRISDERFAARRPYNYTVRAVRGVPFLPENEQETQKLAAAHPHDGPVDISIKQRQNTPWISISIIVGIVISLLLVIKKIKTKN